MKLKVFMITFAVMFLFCTSAMATEIEDTEYMEEYDEAELFQAGSIIAPHTLPEEAELMEDDSILYSLLEEGFKNHEEKIDIQAAKVPYTGEGIANLRKIYSKVVNDNPEYFYVRTGYSISYSPSRGMILSVSPIYFDLSGEGDAQKRFDDAVEQAMAQIDNTMSDLEKALALHDYLVLNTAYNWEVATNKETNNPLVYSAYGPLVQGDAVCQGYALAYKLLLKQAGIECSTLSSEEMNHMWNLIKLDGKWYHVDATWDDPTPNRAGYCGYKYFLMSDATISDTEHNHHDWEQAVPCNDKKYESGWIFNGGTYTIYQENNAYYYVKLGRGNDFQYALYKTEDLSQAGNEICSKLANSYTAANGLLWKEKYLYYIPYAETSQTLKRCNLESGNISEVGTFTFVPTGADKYTDKYDGIGIQYNSTTNEIELISHTRRFVLAKFAFLNYPENWDAEQTSTVKIAGITDDKKCAGLIWGTNASRDALVLYVACYQKGKLVGVRCQSVQYQKNGLQLVDLDWTDMPQYDSLQLMLLTSDCIPVCAAFQR